MIENWVKIFSSNELMQVKLAEDVLKQHEIVSHIVHKPDSVLPMLGEAELYTKPEQAETAVNVLKEHRFNMEE
jgi:hypothetical protein